MTSKLHSTSGPRNSTKRPKPQPEDSNQTLILAIAVGLAYLGFVLSLGLRSIVLFSGGAIALATLGSWLWQLQTLSQTLSQTHPSNPESSTANLLNPDIFRTAIQGNHAIPAMHQTLWRSLQQEAQSIHHLAQEISHLESWVIPEILELLYGIVERLDRLAKLLILSAKLQPGTAQQQTNQRIQTQYQDLQHIRQRLHDLLDQMLVSQLDSKSLTSEPNLHIPLPSVATALQQLSTATAQPS